LRLIKDGDELVKLRDAAALGAKLYKDIKPTLRAGVKESDIAAELEYCARRSGAEAMSFETIVAGGARSALPHGRASEQVIPARGFVILDFGVILSGYCSDLTRTVHVGAADPQAKKRYAAVLKAQMAAIEAVRPGVSVSAVDAAARHVLEREQLAQFFTHSTGHGLGLEIHEPPRIAKGQRQRLRPGMVITIEPGVYVAGEGGVRIEDMVLVTQSGCEVLTAAPKEFSVV
jgi:Xaa-Pro aminopeptidase